MRNHPATFFALILPYGASFGYVSVAFPYIATHRGGLSAEQAGSVVAAAFGIHAIKFLWAPIVDAVWTKRAWYLVALLLVVAGTIASSAMPIDVPRLPVLTAVILASQLGLTLMGMACESFLAAMPDDQKGRASGFYQAGAVGGVGLGGGAALWMSEQFSAGWMVGATVGGAMIACGVPVFRLIEPPALERSVIGALRALGRDLRQIATSRIGLVGLVVCLSPVGAGAATSYFGPNADAWHTSARVVALVTGVVGGVIGAGGALAGGWLADRLDRRHAYALGGGLTAVTGIVIALAPHTPSAYVVLTLAYTFCNGAAAAAFTSLVLETIGHGAVATKYNIFASVANFAVTYSIRIDGRAQTHWGANGMFLTDAALTFVGIAVMLTVLRVLRPQSSVTSASKSGNDANASNDSPTAPAPRS